jgi:hypothetical protein
MIDKKSKARIFGKMKHLTTNFVNAKIIERHLIEFLIPHFYHEYDELEKVYKEIVSKCPHAIYVSRNT